MTRQHVGVAALVCASGIVLCVAGKRYLRLRASRRKSSGNNYKTPQDETIYKCSALEEFMKRNRKKKAPAVDKVFLKQLLKLIKIAIPSVISKEFAVLLVHTCSLVARTFLSIYVAHLDGHLVKAIVDRNLYAFLQNCFKWVLLAVPATFINSLLRYLECKLALAIRTRLVNYAYSLYFKNQTYYRVSNLDGRLANPDHSLTEDMQAFSSAVTHIYSHISKPLLDVLLMSNAVRLVAKRQGEKSPYPGIIGFSTIFATGWFLKVCSPPFGKLVAEEARRNAHLRYIHSRLITNAEEVAFYDGHKVNLSSVGSCTIGSQWRSQGGGGGEGGRGGKRGIYPPPPFFWNST